MRTGVIIAVLAVAGIGSAHAQLFKCKGPDGKVVYSDTRCESGATAGALPPGVNNKAHENEAKAAADKAAADKAAAERKAQAEALVEAARKAGLVAPAPAAGTQASPSAQQAPKRYELTNADHERIRSLEIDSSRLGASSEQKRAFGVYKVDDVIPLRRFNLPYPVRFELDEQGHVEYVFDEQLDVDSELRSKLEQLVSDAISGGNVQAINYFVAQKYIEAFKALAEAPNQKFVMMPMESAGVIGSLGGIAELAREAMGQPPRVTAPTSPAPRTGG